MSAAHSEMPSAFERAFRKFEMGPETAIRGDCVFGGLIDRPLAAPPILECIAKSIDQQGMLSLIVSVFQMVLYRNSYQEEFDLALVDLRGGLQAVEPEVWLSSFDADTYALTAQGISSRDYRLSQGSMHAASGSDVLVFIADTCQKVADHEFLKRHTPILALVVRQNAADISLAWLYRESVIVNQIVNCIERQIWVLINEMFVRPDYRLIDLKVVADAEVENQSFFRGQEVVSNFVALSSIVENYALSQPNTEAVRCGSKSLTYKELVEYSQRFSENLHQFGVVKGSKVVAFLEPSELTLVAILGIHRAGAVYVPVDPSFPADRISAILEEVKPVLIVSNTDTAPLQRVSSGAIYTIADLIAGTAKSSEKYDIDPDAVSHIFFTSGTTGRPKGVVSTHRNLAHYLESAVNRYRFNASDRFVAAARFTFSISLFELLVPLSVGASVEILPRSTVLDLKKLVAAVERATVFHFGPSLLKKMLPYIRENYGSFEPFASLRHVSSGGDWVPPEILEGMKEIFFNAEVYVIYGCSEISCMGCTYEAPRGRLVVKTKVGKPMQNMQVRVLDVHGNYVPRGIAGRVHFAGAGLVKEYLGQPELTAHKFQILDGVRYYDTGDIGCIDAEGNLELLGRDDFQVKIRGIRIEVQEIEKWLKLHPLVSDCVVVAKEINGDERSLIAYLVAKSSEINSAELIRDLSEKLPDYMVPSIYVGLEALPLNHNGKLDRAQLPHPSKDNILLSTAFKQAEDDIEQFLISVWEKSFGISGIGIDHCFFELGGDSLRAVQILMEIEAKYERLLSIGDLLADTTIRGFAKKVREHVMRPPAETESVVLFRKGNDDKPRIFLLDAVLLYKDLAKALNCDRTVYALYLPEDIQQVKDVISQHQLRFSSIISSYVKQIRQLQPAGPYLICGHSFGGLIAMEVARQLRAEGEAIQLLAMIDTWCPGFRYNMNPLLRLVEHLRMVWVHGWSYVGERLKLKYEKLRNIVFRIAEPPPRDNNEAIDLRWLIVTLMDGKTFVPAKYDEPVLLFKAKKRAEFQPLSRYLGWKNTLKSVSVQEVSGDHYGMLESGNVEEMAATIMEHIGGDSNAATAE